MNDQRIEKFGFLIHDAARLLRRRFEAKAQETGLSAAQWRVLARLVKLGPMTQAKLAELLEVEPISVSRLIDRMEQSGWVERRADEADRRAKMLHPTDQAREAFAAVKAIAASVYGAAMEGIDNGERVRLIAALETIVTNLSDISDETNAAPDLKKQAAR